MRRFCRQLKRAILVPQTWLYWDRGSKPVIFLSSSPRSGSTWLQEVIASAKPSRILFEPLYLPVNREGSGWCGRQYLSRTCKQTEFHEPLERILQGRVRNSWVDRDNKSFSSELRVIKDVRSNLLLPNIAEQFPAVKIVLLLRHPISVYESRTRLQWESDLQTLTTQEDFLEKHFPLFKKEAKTIKTRFEEESYFWGIENIVPLRELKEGEAYPIFYEHLNDEPVREVRQLFQFLGLDFEDKTRRAINLRSRTQFQNKQKDAALTKVGQDAFLRAKERFENIGLTELYQFSFQERKPCIGSGEQSLFRNFEV